MALTPMIASPESDHDILAENPHYFHFARVRFTENGYFFRMGWAHDYPRAEQNFLKILAEVTGIQTTPASYVIVDLDDPLIMDYPLLYFSEPGTWGITDREAKIFASISFEEDLRSSMTLTGRINGRSLRQP